MIPGGAIDERVRQLMRRAQQGDSEAYRAVLEEITPRIRRLVRKKRSFTGPERVEDLVQDVLLSIHAVRHTYDPTRPFIPWMMAIVRNRLADGARRHARQEAHELAMDDLDVTSDGLHANITMEVERGPLAALAQAIGALPPGQRQAIEMLKLNEMSLKEASSATGLSVGALKLATHRAMTALRKAMRKKTHEDR